MINNNKNNNKIIKFFFFFILLIFINVKIVSSSNVFLSTSTSTSSSIEFYLEDGYCPPPLEYRYTDNWDHDESIGYKYVNMPNNTKSYCVKPCPSMYFTDKEWTDLMNMSLIVASVSFFASIFLIFSYSVLNKNYMNRNNIAMLFFFFGIFLIMFTDMYNLKKRYTLGCPDPNRYAVQSDAECIVTGLMFQYGCVSAMIWYTVISIDIYFQLTKKNFPKKYDKFIFIGITAFSLLISLLPIIGNTYGYGDFALGCWILNFNYALPFFWVPLSLSLVISTVVVSLILFEIYKIYKASKLNASLKGYIKPVLCLVSNCLEFFYVFGYSLYLATQLSALQDNMENYVKCLFINAYNEPGTYECPRQRIGMAPQFLFLLSLRLLGVSGIIFYGFNSKIKKIWLDSIFFNNRFIGKYFSRSATTNSPTPSINKNSSQLAEGTFNEYSGIQEEQSKDEDNLDECDTKSIELNSVQNV